LALRDGDAPPEVATHVAQCAICAAELEDLRRLRDELRRLPVLDPGGDGWERLGWRIGTARRRLIRRRWLAAAAMLIAGAILVAAGLMVSGRQPGRPAARAAADEAVIDHLISASRQLELVLQSPALRSRVLTPGEAAEIVDLEDGIALIDARLAASDAGMPRDQQVVLWTDRVGLLDELLQARGGSPRPLDIQRASMTDGEGRNR